MKKLNHILYVDTSMAGMNAAVYQYSDEKKAYTCKDHLVEFNNQRASSNIAMVLDTLLHRNTLSLQDENLGFCFAKGPGSFTGIKVGIAAMLAVKFSREDSKQDAVFAAFSAMQEIWKSLQNRNEFQEKNLEIILPASRNEFYACFWDFSMKKLREEVFDLRSPSDIKRWLSLDTFKCFLSSWPELEAFLQSKSQPCMVIPIEKWFMYTQSDSMLLSLQEANWGNQVEEANFLRDASPIQNRKLIP